MLKLSNYIAADAIAANPRAIWLRMANTTDFDRIVKTMLREGVVRSEERARDLITAYTQWMSVATSSGDKPYLMFCGPVDNTFHCFVLNTEFYADFCQKHLGKFIHHNPLDADQAGIVAAHGGIEHTVRLLEQHFGEELHPELKKWARRLLTGSLTPSSVSCVQCE